MSESAILTIVASIVTGFVTVATMVVGLFTLWIKLKYEKRTSTETILKGQQETQEQVKEAVVEAKEATNAMAADVSRKLNGGLDHSVAKAVAPIKVTLQEHHMVITELMEEHAKNMAEMKAKFEEMDKHIHRRNNEILDKFSTTAYGVQAILEMLKADREGRKYAETRVD